MRKFQNKNIRNGKYKRVKKESSLAVVLKRKENSTSYLVEKKNIGEKITATPKDHRGHSLLRKGLVPGKERRKCV